MSGTNGTAACRARVYGGHRERALSPVVIFSGLVAVDSLEVEVEVAVVGAHMETSPVRCRGESGVSVVGGRPLSQWGGLVTVRRWDRGVAVTGDQRGQES